LAEFAAYGESQNAVTQASTLACSLVVAVMSCVKLGLSPRVAPAVFRDVEYRILYVARGRTKLAVRGGPGSLRPSRRSAPKSHSFSMLLLTGSPKSRPAQHFGHSTSALLIICAPRQRQRKSEAPFRTPRSGRTLVPLVRGLQVAHGQGAACEDIGEQRLTFCQAGLSCLAGPFQRGIEIRVSKDE
jgi:hypothetical protein